MAVSPEARTERARSIPTAISSACRAASSLHDLYLCRVGQRSQIADALLRLLNHLDWRLTYSLAAWVTWLGDCPSLLLLDEREMDPGKTEDEFVPPRVEADEGRGRLSRCRVLPFGEGGFKQRQSP